MFCLLFGAAARLFVVPVHGAVNESTPIPRPVFKPATQPPVMMIAAGSILYIQLYRNGQRCRVVEISGVVIGALEGTENIEKG